MEQEAEMPQNSSGCFGEDRKMSGINPQLLSHPTCGLVTVPTELGKYSGKEQSNVIWLSVGSNGRLANMVAYLHIP